MRNLLEPDSGKVDIEQLELKGFAEPKYALELEDGLGLYRRTFRVPAAWRDGRRVCLRFEGVAFGFEAWLNGKAIGKSSASGQM